MEQRRLLVVGAHSADFVWRAAGTIARHTGGGGEARVVALSYGERGESGELWKTPGQTVENVKRIRHEEATAAALRVGAEFHCLDLGDYPLEVGADALARLVEIVRNFSPHVVITHPERDPFNPDHPAAYAAVARARLLTSGSGVASAFPTVKPSEFLAFEPHQPELCGFVPTTFVDISSVIEQKHAAMEAMASQAYLRQYYSERAAHRGNHARKLTGDKSIQFAEAFHRLLPVVVRSI